MLGMSLSTFTAVHVVISLVGIFAGLVVLGGFLSGVRLDTWTDVFLATTVLTSVTGFMFPINGVTPALVFGAVSLMVLAIALLALYGFQLTGPWRWIYVVTALMALYLNVFVAIVQSFQKFRLLRALAPTQSEPAFAITHACVALLFLIAGYFAVTRFRAESGFSQAGRLPS